MPPRSFRRAATGHIVVEHSLLTLLSLLPKFNGSVQAGCSAARSFDAAGLQTHRQIGWRSQFCFIPNRLNGLRISSMTTLSRSAASSYRSSAGEVPSTAGNGAGMILGFFSSKRPVFASVLAGAEGRTSVLNSLFSAGAVCCPSQQESREPRFIFLVIWCSMLSSNAFILSGNASR